MAMLAVLAGCAMEPVAPPGPAPRPRPAELTPPPAPERSKVSFALEDYYARVESGLVVRGLLRGDGGGPDVPFDADTLVRTFEEIVFFQEFSRQGDRLVPTSAPSPLNRWIGPVRLQPVFGATVSEAERAQDVAEIARLQARLARVSGHPISTVAENGNFLVLVVHEDERLDLASRLRDAIPELSDADVDAILDMPRGRYCLVVTSDPLNDGNLQRAVAIIRAEHPRRLRTSCLHEEIAQGLGLQNDSPTARPSIFTDEEEFGRLTTMDEFLVAMLYDPRLTPGMTADAARPILKEIAAELLAPAA